MARTEAPRIAVLGAGPIGLEAALYALHLGFPTRVYERSRVGEYVRRWGHVRLFSPFGMNCTSLGRDALRADDPHFEFPDDGAIQRGRDYVDAYLEPLAHTSILADCLRLETTV